MELRDYGIALRRYWKTWVSLTVAGLLCALAIVLNATPTYQASATVFVAGTGDATGSSQFVSTRVKGYPDVAVSQDVLQPVIDELGLKESFDSLRSRVSSSNPPDTSQIEIAVTDVSPLRAAAVANAVARRFGTEVEQLERPVSGVSPVALTVTIPATVPAAPVFPNPPLLLLLGGVVGVALGVSAAVIRSRLDTRVYDQVGFHAAWGAEDRPEVVTAGRRGRWVRRRSHGRLLGEPMAIVVRRLAALSSSERPLRTVVVSLPADDGRVSAALAGRLAAGLRAEEIRVAVTGDRAAAAREATPRPGVELRVGSPAAPLREWRRLAGGHDGVLLVLQPGRVHRAELVELRSILSTVELPVLAVVFERRRRGSGPMAAGSAGAATSPPVKRPVLAQSSRIRSAVGRSVG